MKQVVLTHALSAAPTAGDFRVIDAPTPDCPEGGVVAEVAYLSLDPYVGSRLRGRHMGEPAPRPGLDPIPGAIVGRVAQTRTPRAREGDVIHTMQGGWAQAVAVSADGFRVIDPAIAPLSAHLGVLGMPGLTAWAGVTQLAKVGAGDVFLVDAASGAVGGAAGQIARQKGASRVVGLAGGPQKCAIVEDRYRFDACIDSRAQDWRAALDTATPDGVSAHFENVGQDLLLAAIGRLRPYGRIVLCGLAAHYQTNAPPAQLPIGALIGKRAQVFGLVVYDFYDRWAEFLDEAAPWVRAGSLTIVEDRVEGLDAAPALFEKLMRGENVGKALVAVSP
ncbi:MAG: zinc-binding dehydrogenase [Caulobacterales bacterium]